MATAAAEAACVTCSTALCSSSTLSVDPMKRRSGSHRMDKTTPASRSEGSACTASYSGSAVLAEHHRTRPSVHGFGRGDSREARWTHRPRRRMSHVVDAVRAARPQERIAPLFVSCDPRRDSLEAIDEYLSVFHPDFIGLVGTPKQVNDACRSYRIYYSIPTEEDAEQEDYLIDHSIAIFLFDPQGRFVDFFGNRYDEREITEKVLHYMSEYAKDPTWTNW